MNLIIVGLGGGLGAMLRYLSYQGMIRVFGPGLPWGTAFVNVFGSFLMGLAAIYFLERAGAPRLGGFIMPGVLGGFTTFSAFSLDAARLMETGRLGAAALYVGGSVVISILGLFAGLAIGRTLL
ncbi:MAG: CrcB family protein [Paracoccaceae bacterium]